MKTLFLFLFLPILALAQIGQKVQSATNTLSGKWTNKSFGFDMILELKSDGSGTFDGEKITYTSTAAALNLKTGGETTSYQYKLNDNTLTLSGGDLDSPINFTRSGANPPSTSYVSPKSPTSAPKTSNTTLSGTWSGNGVTVTFQSNGQGVYNDAPFTYTTTGNTLIATGSEGTSYFQYEISGNYLTLLANGTSTILQRGAANATPSNNTYAGTPTTSGQLQGTIDPSVVGKWCWANTSSTYSTSSSSSRCIVINANGTYEYYYEGSISGYSGGGYGGSASQSSDSGTWRLKGNQLYVQSQAEGFKIYSFEKRNHPKNSDPMIVIDGETFVTFYQRSPW